MAKRGEGGIAQEHTVFLALLLSGIAVLMVGSYVMNYTSDAVLLVFLGWWILAAAIIYAVFTTIYKAVGDIWGL